MALRAEISRKSFEPARSGKVCNGLLVEARRTTTPKGKISTGGLEEAHDFFVPVHRSEHGS